MLHAATLALLVAAAGAFTVLVSTPPIDGCQSFYEDTGTHPVRAVFPGQCNVIVTCEDTLDTYCE